MGEPFETEARKSSDILLTKKDPLSLLRNLYNIHRKNLKSNSRRYTIRECEAFPKDCKPENILLFRGQSIVPQPGISGLVRSHWAGTTYSQGKNFPEIITKLQNDVLPLRQILAAPGGESSDPVDRLILAEGKWWGELESDGDGSKLPASRSLFPLRGDRGTDEFPYLNFKQILFTFHVSADYLYFEDLISGQKVLLDPLISFSSNLNQAMVFAIGNLQANEQHKPGQLIVISVPEMELSSLCGGTVKAGNTWSTSKCSEYLNEYDDENEYDVVGYIRPDQIRASFFVNWEDIAQETQIR